METNVVHVDLDNVNGPWDGKSWGTAFLTVQEGLDVAAAHDGGEVWVAEGTYKPTSTTDRSVSIQLKPGVALYGGFNGTETERDQRDWVKNETILSGDIGAGSDKRENSFHVVIGADNAIIDGFTITGGNSLPPPGEPRPHHMSPELLLNAEGRGTGAGILNFQSAPIVRNCIIRDNVAAKGAGMYNMATRNWPAKGVQPAPTVVNCTFTRNYAMARGGAVSNDLNTHSTFIDCTFTDNVCDGKGGGIYNDFSCSPTLVNCLFARNTAMKGGAMGNDGLSCPTLTNCTFVQNYARDMYGGVYNGTGPTNTGNNPIVANCIFWRNTALSGRHQIGNWHGCVPVVTYSCVEGGYDGEGNIDVDPLFVDPDGGDYHLGPGSPCIDSGNGAVAPATDRDGRPRYDDKGSPTGSFARVPFQPKGEHLPVPSADAAFNPPVDMGAYERQADSAKGTLTWVVHVSAANVAGPWDGNSWATAYRDLQEALADAYMRAKEVWVAAGTYKPASTTDRRISFRLKSGLALYGGFAGDETERGQRDWVKNVTILSGKIGDGDDDSGNSYHVIVGADKAILDGFTVTGGNANGVGFYRSGGGMVNYNGSSPTVSHCIFTRNQAVEGGAMYNYNLSAPTIDDCVFADNSAGKGGAIVNRVGSAPAMMNCRFVGNRAQWRGGAMLIDYGSGPQITGCAFEKNTSGGHGGGVFLESVAAQLGIVSTHFDRCTFTANSAELRGGAMASSDGGNPLVTNCAFTRNHAGRGGGAMANDYHVQVTVGGCTFVANSAREGEADIDTDESSVVRSM